MNTESRRKASATFHADRKAKGWIKRTVWLDPETAMKIDALKASAGSADEVHRQAIKAWPGPGAEVSAVKPVKAPPAPKAAKPPVKAAAKAEPAGQPRPTRLKGEWSPRKGKAR